MLTILSGIALYAAPTYSLRNPNLLKYCCSQVWPQGFDSTSKGWIQLMDNFLSFQNKGQPFLVNLWLERRVAFIYIEISIACVHVNNQSYCEINMTGLHSAKTAAQTLSLI